MAQPCELSWQPFVDQLTNSNAAKYAAICGLNGSVWAASPGFNITKDQILHLVSGFDPNNNDFKCQRITFEIIYERKYMVIRNDENLILASSGPTIVAASKSKTALVIGVTDEKIQPGQCTAGVERMADYLRDQGY